MSYKYTYGTSILHHHPSLATFLLHLDSRKCHYSSNSQNNMTTFKLNTGASIPALGFGTWQDKDDQEKAVAEALKAGVRHIDTARGKTSSGHVTFDH